MRSLILKRSPTQGSISIALHDVIGVLVGVALPLVAAALYRTYSISVTPGWFELTRQLGLPFVAGEIGVILWARRQGFDPASLVAELPRLARWAFWLFLGTFWISSLLTSEFWSFSTALTMSWIVHLLFGGAIYHLARGCAGSDVIRLGAGLSIGLAILSAWTAVHFLFPPPGLVVDQGLTGWGAAIPGFISHRLFGAWAGAVSVLLFGLLWQASPSGSSRPWLYPAFVLATAVVVWTGTRGAVLGFAVGVLAVILMAGRPATRTFYWKVPVAIILATLIGVSLQPYDDPAFMFYRPGTYGSANGISSGRVAFWSSALHVAAAHPWLGSGAGSCWWLVSDGGMRHVQPHNAVVQFLLSWGLVPTLPLLGLLGWMTFHIHRIARETRAIIPLVMMVDALLAMSMMDGMLYFARFVMLITALYAICLGQEGRAKR